MKEATEFGIKYLRTMPNGKQVFVMHQNIWHDRKEAEQMVENLKGVVACPLLVEIWDPIEVQALNEAADELREICPADCLGKAKEPLPEPEPGDKEPEQPKENPTPTTNWTKKQITYTSRPDGSVTITEDGKDISDPEQRKRLQDNLDHMFDDLLSGQWPWLRNQSKKRKTDQELVQDRLPFPFSPIWLWDPSQAPFYGIAGEHRPRFQCEASNPAFKCEAGD